jgi:hypothetical protein
MTRLLTGIGSLSAIAAGPLLLKSIKTAVLVRQPASKNGHWPQTQCPINDDMEMKDLSGKNGLSRHDAVQSLEH